MELDNVGISPLVSASALMMIFGKDPMKYRHSPAVLVLLLALTLLPASPADVAGSGATPVPDHITLTWTGDPATSITISWRTDTSVTAGFVQYKPGNAIPHGAPQVKAEARDFSTDLGTSRLFSATLVNLAPNRQYSYRVGDGNRWSEMRSFSTADPKIRSFKFLVFGDSQWHLNDNPPYLPWRNTVHNAYNANPDARFMINVGDLVDWGQRGAHWNAWFAAAKGVIDRIPIMPASGNHESYGSRDTMRPKFWTEQFTLPRNGPDGHSNVYSFDYGPLHVVVLDSQQEEQKQYGDILKPQVEWLEADLKASKATWKIAVFHRPPYGVHIKRNEKEIREAFCPVLEKYGVDIVFGAHDHGIARTYPVRNGARMQRTSEGTIYYVVGHSGGKVYKDIEKKELHAFFHNPVDHPNYLVVNVGEKQMTVRVMKQDGTLIDTFSVDKKKRSRPTDY